MVKRYWQGKTEVLGRKPVPVPHHQASLVRSHELTPEPCNDLSVINVKVVFIELYLILHMNACLFLMNASLLVCTGGTVLCDQSEIIFVLNLKFLFLGIPAIWLGG
jgi:hypothetical protein